MRQRDAGVSEPGDVRVAGVAKMQEVSVDPANLPGRYPDITVDHLFGTVWNDDTIDLPQRRLVTVGVLAAPDKPELLEFQFYVGWPISVGISGAAEKITRRRAGATKG
jgi:alkylhydroperoxidase/carboxymuconolactone decarboxylase family protein YurZ